MTADRLTAQIRDELDRALVGPVSALCGMDLGDMLRRRLATAAPAIAAQLRAPDDQLVAETVIDVMGALWPNCAPEDCEEAHWWRSPLGQACARSLGHSAGESVTHSVAAAMLGVPRSNIGVWVRRGKLDRHPDGGVLRSSVFQLLADGGSGLNIDDDDFDG